MADVLNRDEFSKAVLVRQTVDKMLELDQQVIKNGGEFDLGSYGRRGSIAGYIKTGRPRSLQITGINLNQENHHSRLEVSIGNIEDRELSVGLTISLKNTDWDTDVILVQIPPSSISTFTFEIDNELVNRDATLLIFAIASYNKRVVVEASLADYLPTPEPEPEEAAEEVEETPRGRGRPPTKKNR